MNQPASGFVIEHGIQPPPPYETERTWASNTAREMKAGDSVYFDALEPAKTLLRAVTRKGGRGVMRKLEKGGWRIWRVK